jgi:hypothetical protein
VSEDPADPGPRQEEIIRRIDENVDTETAELDAAVEAVRAQDADNFGALGVAVASRASTLEVNAVKDAVDALSGRYDTGQRETVAALASMTEALRVLTDAVAKQGLVLDAVKTDTTKILGILREPPEPGSWQDQPDLIDTEFRPVLGVHTGGEGQTKSDPKAIADRMSQRIQAAPIYWKTTDSPRVACQRMLDAGTIPRLELCLPHIVTSTGRKMTGDFWRRFALGDENAVAADLLKEVGALDRPILLSTGHESDLRSEDGASPKNPNPPADTYCGAYADYPAYWAQFAKLARQYAPKARLFLNLSGGYEGAGGTWDKGQKEWLPGRWDAMLPPPGTFDFFGYDFYNMWGKQDGANWDPFETRLKMFGRWDWYKRTIPDVPVIIGETATCQGPGGDKDAGPWLLDMVDFLLDNRWQGVGTGGGISQVHYFSHHYTDHPRCLDEPHDGTGQMWDVLPQVGADERLAWA